MPRRNNSVRSSKNTNSINMSIANLIALLVAVLVGGLTIGAATASALNWGGRFFEIQSLNEKYDALESEYNALQKRYNEITNQSYHEEYNEKEGGVIINPQTGYTISIRGIYEFVGHVDVSLWRLDDEAKKKNVTLYKAEPYDLVGDGRYFIILKAIDNDTCTIVITEKESEQ